MNQLAQLTDEQTSVGTMTSAQVAMSISQSQRAMHKLLSTCLGHHGLNVAQWMMLGVLSDGPQTPTAMAKLLEIKTPYVTMLIKQLKALNDVVTEVNSAKDTRTKTLALSEHGVEFVARIEAKLQVCIQRELAQNIAPVDLQTYFTVSDYIAKNVKHLPA